MKKRILIFSLSYFPLVAGAEVALKEITDRLGNDSVGQVEFDMITMRFSKSHPENEKIGNINVYRIGGGIFGKMRFLIEASSFAKKLMQKNNYDSLWGMMTYMLVPI